MIKHLVEETNRYKAVSANSNFGRKALMLPTAFVIKARKQ